jgi:eukaryotic-like serine/threonine-protein kinase
MSKRPLTLPFRAGELVGGKYLIDKLVGEGGIGYVVAARHVELDEYVALKFLRPEALADPEIVSRFAREARASIKIKSEHVPRVLDLGSLPEAGPFIVMEHLDGSDLGAVLHERGSLAVTRAVEYVIQACDALATAHAAGIVHRDIKPENLFLARRAAGLDVIKVLDFGISKVAIGEKAHLPDTTQTATRAVTGSLSYMSPEQIRGDDVDHRTDIWSLGAVLYELLAGRNAFDASSVTALSAEIMKEDPAPIGTLRPDVPADLAVVVARCLSKDPAARYQDVADLALALLPFAPRRSVLSAEQCVATLRAAGWRTRSEHPAAGGGAGTLEARPEDDTLPPPPPCGIQTSIDPTVGGGRFSKEVLFSGRYRRLFPLGLGLGLAAVGAALGAGGSMLLRSSDNAAGPCVGPATAAMQVEPPAATERSPQGLAAPREKRPDAGY